MQAFLFHGYNAHPDGNWFRWLKRELEALGCPTYAPKLPTPEMQTVNNWRKVLLDLPPIDEDTLLIGHSLGGSFLLSVLEQHTVKAAFIVAAPFGLLHHDLDSQIAEFTNKAFDWAAIKANCKKYYLYYSEDDSYVPLVHGERLAKQLGIPFTKVQGSGHFQFQSFPRLLADVKKEL